MLKRSTFKQYRDVQWQQCIQFLPFSYQCGYCSDKVASKEGYFAQGVTDRGTDTIAYIYICPSCNLPTVKMRFVSDYAPTAAPGNDVLNVPEELGDLYTEARNSVSVGAYTGAVLLCRKILMHIAVTEGAEANQSFLNYVRFLTERGFVPPNGRGWVDYIRVRGNEANHEIELMNSEDAIALVTFVEMLLKFIYEFPNKVPSTTSTTK